MLADAIYVALKELAEDGMENKEKIRPPAFNMHLVGIFNCTVSGIFLTYFRLQHQLNISHSHELFNNRMVGLASNPAQSVPKHDCKYLVLVSQ